MKNNKNIMKVVTIVGARPQFIKAGTLSREIQKHNNIEEIIIHTGQHFDINMSDVFFKEMNIPVPKYNLNINGKDHGAMTGQMLEKLEVILKQENPDWVLLYGDTNSTLSGALAASKLNIKIAHIEAGLRSFNMKMPEEINRIITDRLSTILFCPSSIALKNLNKEGFPNKIINGLQLMYNVGDVMQDGALYYSKLAKRPVVDINEEFILATIHRAENTNDVKRLTSILEALVLIASEKKVVIPIHPRTKKIILKNKIKTNNITFLDPVGYLEMVWLIKNSTLVMTDSGGLQKEAYFFEKPCITLRDETEWIELVNNKFNVLVGADKKLIIEAYRSFKFNENFTVELYGGGKASQKIVNTLLL